MRSDMVMIRLKPEERRLFEEVADQNGLTTSSWARRELLRSANGRQNYHDAIDFAKWQELGLLSLFCGPGGLDEGFEQAGFRTLLATDIDRECCNTFLVNHPHTKVFTADIRALEPEDLDHFLGRKCEPVGVLGGPPCQSFSVSNVHQSDDDPRHCLPEAYAALLAKLNKRHPISFFVFENVPGLLGSKHRHRYEQFKALFEDAGFSIHESLLDAQHYGVPQERMRVIIVGINQAKHPGATWQPPAEYQRILTVRETIGGLAEPVPYAPGLDPEAFPVHPNHWCLVPRSRKFLNGSLKEGEMWGRSFRTLVWDKPSWTVAYGHREVHVHPNGHRRLSIYEAMLLQSFPVPYRLTGNLSAQIRLVSEAVPPRLALNIAVSIRQTLGI